MPKIGEVIAGDLERQAKAAKVAYVKKQGQTRDHHCHGRMPGCRGQCPPAMWGCKNCWFKLPMAIRNRIWETYRAGQEVNMTPSMEYLEAAHEAQEWIDANYSR